MKRFARLPRRKNGVVKRIMLLLMLTGDWRQRQEIICGASKHQNDDGSWRISRGTRQMVLIFASLSSATIRLYSLPPGRKGAD